MAKKKSLTYAEAGVSIDANAEFVDSIRKSVKSTFGPRVFTRHGAFAGQFRLDYDEQLFRRNYKRPLLVGCTDGVGTKVLIALALDKLDTIGIDLVAMNVNDLITTGAEPLFFLDYLAVHKLDPPRLARIVEGIAAGCREAGCALIGGETAEMPDLYKKGDFDLAGFSVGVVEFGRSIDVSRVEPGDELIALPSSGVHSNGYSLVRKLLDANQISLNQYEKKLGETVGEALLRPTRIYVQPVLSVLRQYKRKHVVTAMAHITGGGLPENLARALPDKCDAVVHTNAWKTPPIFPYLKRLGVKKKEMFNVFNMGIGYIMIVKPAHTAGVMKKLQKSGETPLVIGKVKKGVGRVELK
jgi:phosphoribosylformylglycinamidine cyclo-ligase